MTKIDVEKFKLDTEKQNVRNSVYKKFNDVINLLEHVIEIQGGNYSTEDIKKAYTNALNYKLMPGLLHLKLHNSNLQSLISSREFEVYKNIELSHADYFKNFPVDEKKFHESVKCICANHSIINSYSDFLYLTSQERKIKEDKIENKSLEYECIFFMEVLMLDICKALDKEFRAVINKHELETYNLLYEKLKLFEEGIKGFEKYGDRMASILVFNKEGYFSRLREMNDRAERH